MRKASWLKGLGKILLAGELLITSICATKLEIDTRYAQKIAKENASSFIKENNPPTENLFMPSRYSKVIYQNIPNATIPHGEYQARINSDSMRDNRDYPIKKNPETFRIAVIGDSFTFGVGTEMEDSYIGILRKIFERNNSNIEILNAGCTGYNALQEVESYKKVLRKYTPDLILVGAFFNDARIPCTIKVPKEWSPGEEIKKSFFNEDLFDPRKAVLINGGDINPLDPDNPANLPKWYRKYFTGKPKDVRKAYEELRAMGNERSIPIVLGIIYHDLLQDMPKKERKELENIIETGRHLGFYIADPHESLNQFLESNGYKKLSELEVSLTDFHYREEANMVMALTILKTLTNNKLVPFELSKNFFRGLPYFEGVVQSAKPLNSKLLDRFEFQANFLKREGNLCRGRRIFKKGEPMRVRVKVRNKNKHPITIVLDRTIRKKNYFPENFPLFVDIYRESGVKLQSVYNNRGNKRKEKNLVRILLDSNTTNAFNLQIPEGIQEGLSPGQYTLQITYTGIDPPGGHVLSSTCKFALRSCKWKGLQHELEIKAEREKRKERNKRLRIERTRRNAIRIGRRHNRRPSKKKGRKFTGVKYQMR